MKKVLKWIGIILLVIIAGVLLYGWWKNEPKPTAQPSIDADVLAHKMMDAVNKQAWDTTRVIQWTFRGVHHFLWDRSRQLVKVEWEDKMVLLHTETQEGKLFVDSKEVLGEEQKEALKKAWAYFCNDSFWLNAVTKAFDDGTSRSIVKLRDGRDALMVSYASGGVTPGDAYAWILDKNGLPISYKMWVKIIPVGGMEVTWEDWQILGTGAKVAQMHKSKMFELPITNIKGESNWEKMEIAEDPFVLLN